MQPVWTSAIGLVGALLGSYLTYLFQSRTAQRTSLESRRERRRQEFAEAVATYASTATALRHAEFDRGKKRIQNATPAARDEARQETYRLRAETRSAYYLVRLLADPDADRDLVRCAENVIKLSRLIIADTTTEQEMHERSRAANEALEMVVDAANRRLRDGFSS
jgi:hypothetical protein